MQSSQNTMENSLNEHSTSNPFAISNQSSDLTEMATIKRNGVVQVKTRMINLNNANGTSPAPRSHRHQRLANITNITNLGCE